MKFPALLLAASLALAPSLRAEAWNESIAKLRQVGPEGAGNAEAAAAWSELTALGPEVLVPVLSAMDGSGPLARNWMRTAAETVFERGLKSGAAIPGEAIEAFLLDRGNEPNARRLAYELYAKLAPEAAAALVPGFADDPSPGLRREAVAKLIDEGKAQLEADDKEKSLATLQAALDAAREVDQIDAATKLLREKLGQTVDLPKHFGFLSYWHLVAPFDNTGRAGYDRAYSPEAGVDLAAEYEGKEGKPVKWQEHATPDDYGKVDFNEPFGPLKEVVGYAYTEFEAAEARDAELRLGCKNAWKVWFNGELLFGRDEYHRGQRIDQYSLPVKLREGKNTILVKACQNEQTQDWTVQWEFQLRVCDATGTAILAKDRRPTPEKAAPTRRRGKAKEE
jgi:hypothetical protein